MIKRFNTFNESMNFPAHGKDVYLIINPETEQVFVKYPAEFQYPIIKKLSEIKNFSLGFNSYEKAKEVLDRANNFRTTVDHGWSGVENFEIVKYFIGLMPTKDADPSFKI